MKNYLFQYLRIQMVMQDVDMKYLARKMLLTPAQVYNLFCGKTQWTLEKMWQVMDILSLPPETFGQCFPRNGKQALKILSVEEKK